jgi:hypothetical protein
MTLYARPTAPIRGRQPDRLYYGPVVGGVKAFVWHKTSAVPWTTYS